MKTTNPGSLSLRRADAAALLLAVLLLGTALALIELGDLSPWLGIALGLARGS